MASKSEIKAYETKYGRNLALRRVYNATKKALHGGADGEEFTDLAKCNEEVRTLMNVAVEDLKIMEEHYEEKQQLKKKHREEIENLEKQIDELQRMLKTFNKVFANMTFGEKK